MHIHMLPVHHQLKGSQFLLPSFTQAVQTYLYVALVIVAAVPIHWENCTCALNWD